MNYFVTIVLILLTIFSLNCSNRKKKNNILFLAPLVMGKGSSFSNQSLDSENSQGVNPSNSSQVATPTFSPNPGVITTLSNITISTSTSGATIHYTTNGTTPTNQSTQYSSPLVNSWSLAGKPIQAIAVKQGMQDSAVASAIFSYPPLKTGQTTAYGTGSDGALLLGINRGYTNNGNGTITDNATGLIWQQCSLVGDSSDYTNHINSCNSDGNTFDYSDAVSFCNSLTLAGLSWRLPTRLELDTLIHHGKNTIGDPIIEESLFPNSKFDYWTVSQNSLNTNESWYSSFDDGSTDVIDKTNSVYVRCTSGPVRDYGANLVDNADGTVTDRVTGLIWQKCGYGQTWDSTTNTCIGTASNLQWATGSPNALGYCNSLTLAGKSWRLPNINELKSLLDINKTTSPLINTSFFPGTSGVYWSSTTVAKNTSMAYTIDFQNGKTLANTSKTSNHKVQCVAGP